MSAACDVEWGDSHITLRDTIAGIWCIADKNKTHNLRFEQSEVQIPVTGSKTVRLLYWNFPRMFLWWLKVPYNKMKLYQKHIPYIAHETAIRCNPHNSSNWHSYITRQLGYRQNFCQCCVHKINCFFLRLCKNVRCWIVVLLRLCEVFAASCKVVLPLVRTNCSFMRDILASTLRICNTTCCAKIYILRCIIFALKIHCLVIVGH